MSDLLKENEKAIYEIFVSNKNLHIFFSKILYVDTKEPYSIWLAKKCFSIWPYEISWRNDKYKPFQFISLGIWAHIVEFKVVPQCFLRAL